MQIRVLSEGGLGNQLFQASFAHRLAILMPEHDVSFVNDNSASDRRFSLNGFFASCPHLTESKSHLVLGRNRNEIHRILTRRISNFEDRSYLKKLINEGGPKFSSEKELQEFLRNTSQKLSVLRGYFQLSKYHFPAHGCFESALRNSISANTSDNLLSEKDGVCLHIRRGDFLKFSSHGPLSMDYFMKQLVPLEGKVEKLSVHSDDLGVSHELKHLSFQISESSMSENPWQLLSDARDSRFFIGSNSSLSWWAAFALSRFGDPKLSKISFPSEWFRGVSSRQLGILPPDWELEQVEWL
jgi:hypothetical protein